MLSCDETPPPVPPNELPPAGIAGEIPAGRVSTADRASDWPALAAAGDGSLWTAYVEWDGESSDTVVVRHRDPAGTWGDPVDINDGNWDHYLPAIVAVPGGAMAFWSGGSGGSFDLLGAMIGNDGEA